MEGGEGLALGQPPQELGWGRRRNMAWDLSVCGQGGSEKASGCLQPPPSPPPPHPISSSSLLRPFFPPVQLRGGGEGSVGLS